MGVAADIKLIDPREPVAVVPILRAGLVPTLYLNKLPKQVRRVHYATSRHFHLSRSGVEQYYPWSRWEISRIMHG